MPQKQPLVTVAIPLLNEAQLLPGLLDSVLAQIYPNDRMQVLLVDGGSEDGTISLARDAVAHHHHLELLTATGRSTASALNKALDKAEGQYFVRLDARTRPAPDYIVRVVDRLQEGTWLGVAGPQQAVGRTPAAKVHALALNHPFGTGWPRYRHATEPTESETLYLGTYLVSWLRRIGGWDETFGANEDYDLNVRLRKAGGRLLVDPNIVSTYIVRDSLSALVRQYARYGAWRTVTIRRHPGETRYRHGVPALFVAALALSLLILPLSSFPLLLLVAFYLLIDFMVSLGLSARHGISALPRLLVVFPGIHLSWGVAFWLAWLWPPGSPSHVLTVRGNRRHSLL